MFHVLDPNSKGQIMYFLVNAYLQPLDIHVVTLNFERA